MLSDERLYASLSGAARRTAESRFCTSLIIPKYEGYYREVIERGGASLSASSAPPQ
jgi:hypothetical protein